jgi:hypothetical protein
MPLHFSIQAIFAVGDEAMQGMPETPEPSGEGYGAAYGDGREPERFPDIPAQEPTARDALARAEPTPGSEQPPAVVREASPLGSAFPSPAAPTIPLSPPSPGVMPPAETPSRRGIPWYAWPIAGVLGALLLVLVGCCALSGLAFGLLGHLRNGPELSETTTKAVPVGASARLAVSDPAGNVSVLPGAAGEVRVEATKRVVGAFGGEGTGALRAIQVQVTQTGDAVSIVVRLPAESNTFAGSQLVDLAILVPAQSSVTADLAAGNLTLGALTGQLMVTATAGNVDATGITLSGASRIAATAGNVSLDGALASGASLDVRVTAGNVTLRLPANTPAHLSAQCGAGSVTISGWPVTVAHPSPASAVATGDLSANPSGTITVTVDSGNATIQAR